MKYVIVTFALALLACSTTGVIQTGPDSYMVSRDGGGLGSIKAANIRDANVYCKEQGRLVQITATQEFPGFGMSNNHSEVQFMCLNNGDSRLKGGPLMPLQSKPAVEIINNNSH